VRLWELFKTGQPLGYGKGQWNNVFGHLADVRPWGPKDRCSATIMMAAYRQLNWPNRAVVE
jgi:hypothetical protein